MPCPVAEVSQTSEDMRELVKTKKNSAKSGKDVRTRKAQTENVEDVPKPVVENVEITSEDVPKAVQHIGHKWSVKQLAIAQRYVDNVFGVGVFTLKGDSKWDNKVIQTSHNILASVKNVQIPLARYMSKEQILSYWPER